MLIEDISCGSPRVSVMYILLTQFNYLFDYAKNIMSNTQVNTSQS